jgi:transposase InsO family protein
MEDRRCKLGLAGRLELVSLIEAGATLRQAAACLGVAPATAHRWASRWRAASGDERRSLSCLRTRSAKPRSCPWQLSEQTERSILAARSRTNYGPARLAGLVGHGRSTVWKVLHRHGASRRRRGARQTYRRYEWAQPGALLHIDSKQLPRFSRPGHFAHGDRSDDHRSRGAGYLKVICVVDDHTRLAYAEPHADEDQHSVSLTLARAAKWFSEQGCGPVEAVMSDNHKAYTSQRFQALLAQLGAKHIPTPPRTPRWNGKVERFIQTLDTEWAHAATWPDSVTRDKALRSFMRYYNRRRPHTSLGDRPPISRVQQVRGQDS